MGATVDLDSGMIHATARNGLSGADILLPLPSVGATENLLLAAVLARGTTTIRNAAREPEIADLSACLIAMGAKIAGLGSHMLTIKGGAPLAGAVAQARLRAAARHRDRRLGAKALARRGYHAAGRLIMRALPRARRSCMPQSRSS